MNCEPSCDRLSPVRFAALLAVLLAVMFPEVLLGSRSFFHRDFGALAYPTVFYHRAAFWRGEWPLWNPLSHCGVPLLVISSTALSNAAESLAPGWIMGNNFSISSPNTADFSTDWRAYIQLTLPRNVLISPL